MNKVAAFPGPFIAHGSRWHITGSGGLLGGKSSRDRQASALRLGLPQEDFAFHWLRYSQGPNFKLVPEGIEGRVAAKGPLLEMVYQACGRAALRHGLLRRAGHWRAAAEVALHAGLERWATRKPRARCDHH